MSSNKLQIRYDGKEVVFLDKWKVRIGTRIGQSGHLLFNYKKCNQTLEPIGETLKYKCKQIGIIVDSLAKKEGELVVPNEVVIEYTECLHNTVMKDLCADCGINISAMDDIQRRRITESTSVSMVHSVPELRVSKERAETLGRADERRLLKDRKLVLLVDLDQTLIHTTNHYISTNIPDVHHFQLYGPHTQWYRTKFRPNTIPFLETMSKLFELHICTFGARRYAHSIAHLLDPKEQFFPKDRILSRDECFDPYLKTGNMKSLFPCGDSMVCIIDDREDVWNFAPNLVAVKPYICFRDTGDINAPEKSVENVFDNQLIPLNNKTDCLKELSKREEIDENIERMEIQIQINNQLINEIKENEEKVVKDGDQVKMEIEGQVDIEGKVEMVELDGKVETEEKCELNDKEEPIVMSVTEGKAENVDSEGTVDIEGKGETETKDENDDGKVEIGGEGENESKGESVGKGVNEVEIQTNDNLVKTCETIDFIPEYNTKDIVENDEKNETKIVNNLNEKKISENKTNIETDLTINTENMKINETLNEMNCNSNDVLISDKPIEPKEEPKEPTVEDIDDYLLYLEEILTRIHCEYYREYDEKMKYKSEAEEIRIPDLKEIIPKVRKCVLRGVNIVFSGVIPTNSPPEKNKFYIMAKSLGANVTTDLVLSGSPKTTHLIAAKWGTVKVNKCIKSKSIWIVSPFWLACCSERWERVEERLYPLEKEVLSEKSSAKQLSNTSICRPDMHRSTPKEPIVPKFATYDPKTGKRIRTQPTDEKTSSVTTDVTQTTSKGDGSQRMLEQSRQIQPHNMLDFSPLSGFSINDLQSMGKEVDDACSEGDALSTGNTDSDSDIDIEGVGIDIKGEKRTIQSSSDEDNDGECPKGWSKKKTKKSNQRMSLNVEETNDSTRDWDDFDRNITIDGEEDSTDNESIGSVDEEMALAVEREFLS